MTVLLVISTIGEIYLLTVKRRFFTSLHFVQNDSVACHSDREALRFDEESPDSNRQNNIKGGSVFSTR